MRRNLAQPRDVGTSLNSSSGLLGHQPRKTLQKKFRWVCRNDPQVWFILSQTQIQAESSCGTRAGFIKNLDELNSQDLDSSTYAKCHMENVRKVDRQVNTFYVLWVDILSTETRDLMTETMMCFSQNLDHGAPTWTWLAHNSAGRLVVVFGVGFLRARSRHV